MTQSAIGTVYLKAADAERLATFYQDFIGLQVQRREDHTIYLGAGGEDLLALIEAPGDRRVAGVTGLYHFALLVPSRYHLALSLKHLAETQTPLQGLSDHIVSEAIYLSDPEGNGIEIYRDRPRDEWYRDGELQLATLPMDVDGVVGALEEGDGEWAGLHHATIMGHIHLHVASVADAEAFYRDLLGLDVMFNIGTATFMSYENYHHHVGANIWAGRAEPPADALGLHSYRLNLADKAQLDTIIARIEQADIGVELGADGSWSVRGPSGASITLALRESVA